MAHPSDVAPFAATCREIIGRLERIADHCEFPVFQLRNLLSDLEKQSEKLSIGCPIQTSHPGKPGAKEIAFQYPDRLRTTMVLSITQGSGIKFQDSSPQFSNGINEVILAALSVLESWLRWCDQQSKPVPDGLTPEIDQVSVLVNSVFGTAVHLFVLLRSLATDEDLPFDDLPTNIAETLVIHANCLSEEAPKAAAAQQQVEHYLAAKADSIGDACEQAIQYAISVKGALGAAIDPAESSGKGFRVSVRSVIAAWPTLKEKFTELTSPDDGVRERMRVQFAKANEYFVSQQSDGIASRLPELIDRSSEAKDDLAAAESVNDSPRCVRVLTHSSQPGQLDWLEVRLSECKHYGKAGPATEELYFGKVEVIDVYCTEDGCWFFLDPQRGEGHYQTRDQAAELFRRAGRDLPHELGGTPTTTTTADTTTQPKAPNRSAEQGEGRATEIGEVSSPVLSDNVFKRVNDTWTIRFNRGDTQTGIADSKPARDICFLLANTGRTKDIFDLPDNRKLKPQTGSTPVATKEDYQDLTEQIKACRNLLENERDVEVREEVEQTLTALRKQQNENFSNAGKPRELAGDLTNVIEATQRRVNRWRDQKLTKISPELAAHLHKHLTIGHDCLYDAEVTWDCKSE
jgi:hypothetical protein